MESETSDQDLQDARQWFVLLRDDAATAADRRDFSVWLAADPSHRRAWDEVEQLWTRMDAAVPALRLREALHPAAPAKPRVSGLSHAGRSNARQSNTGLARRGWLKQAAAAALVLCGAAAWYATSHDLLADHRTAVSERRSIALADGSRIDLDADSAMSVSFSADQRRLTLHRGRAFFRVAPDAARPFVVAAGGGEVRALGTAFDVKIGPQAVQVAVSEHAVAVTAGGDTMRLNEGSVAAYDARGLGAAAVADIASLLSWRQDRLFFQDVPLRDVVADLDRYRAGRIVILDDAVAALPVTGFFHAAQADAALNTIAATLPVRLIRLTDRLVVVRAR